ncbi:histidinol-phosphatase HisJ [Amphibacillus sp. MSJ-3]|uniref:histidinol-phosphatase HisJ n=1 Tax=Amphibacillus sp. MSJ-3 TaxID=2841505 RepID=UPI001C0EF754|nr:histidinol-phosphatase HisJ [Amphibacillus sp. MSJ-3]MBU5594173.1 histidinol-phosphatase HisJ [Amphibacillus sp. MSJ-3]
MRFIGDYHIHTPFCPHGSSDDWEQYILKAIALGLEELSFTEHAPLPRSFIDPVPEQDSAMNWRDLPTYLKLGNELKIKYQDQIKINIGFEVDYIEGYEQETKQFLDLYGDQIDDSILSVHMLKIAEGQYGCLDFSPEVFSSIVEAFGSVESVYHQYYQTLKMAIEANLGYYKPTRIGHLTLIEKFSKKFPVQINQLNPIDQLLDLIKEKNYALDLNTAGLYKPDCQSIYPNQQVTNKAKEMGIPLIPGSDSHESATIARGFSHIKDYITYSD